MNGIRVTDLGWKVGGLPILRDINLSVDRGETFSLIGPSGSGKTSLLRCIAGLICNYSGMVELDGENVGRTPPEKRGAVLMRQGGVLFPHLTAAGNIAFGLEIQSRRRRKTPTEIRATVAELLSMIALEDKAMSYPPELSAGQAQRVALAMALAVRPRAVLLDEPFSNLDPITAASIRKETAAILKASGITTILATHDWEDAFFLGGRTGIILGGRLTLLNDDASPKSDDPEVKAYLGGLMVVTGAIEGGVFRSGEIRMGADFPDGEYRAMVTGSGVTVIGKTRETNGTLFAIP